MVDTRNEHPPDDPQKRKENGKPAFKQTPRSLAPRAISKGIEPGSYQPWEEQKRQAHLFSTRREADKQTDLAQELLRIGFGRIEYIQSLFETMTADEVRAKVFEN